MGDTEKFSCILCNDDFKTKQLLQEHFRKHANKEIDIKGKKQTIKSDVKTTINKSVLPSKCDKIPCDACTQTFDTVTQAIQHKFRKHPDYVSKHFCQFCGMQFPLKHTHDKHVLVHKAEKPEGTFSCDQCEATFVTKRGRTYHIRSGHKSVTSFFQPVNTPPPSKKIRINNANEAQSVYYCYLCGAEYIVKFNLQKHLENSHTARERDNAPTEFIKCTTCDALFYNKRAYDSHTFSHKPDDLYVTSEQHRLQTVSRVDQDFDIRRVPSPIEKFIPTYKTPRRLQAHLQKSTSSKRLQDSDDELSPMSDVDSSDSEIDTSTLKEIKQLESSNIKKTSKGTIIKKRLYAIVDSNGEIKETCSDIPKNAVLTKFNVVKIKNSDILKTLKKSETSNVKINIKEQNSSPKASTDSKLSDLENDSLNIKKANKGTVTTKRLYAIVDSNGEIQETFSDIPKNAIRTKSNVVKIKNSDILKTLNKSETCKIKINIQEQNLQPNTNTCELKSSNLDFNGPTCSSKCNSNIIETEITPSSLNKVSPLTSTSVSKLDVELTPAIASTPLGQNIKFHMQPYVRLDRLPDEYENVLRTMKNNPRPR